MASIYISEIFGPTIQGEGQLIGKSTVFVRVGGCDFRCHWCDTRYAVDNRYRSTWEKMTEADILSKVAKLTNDKPVLITLSGGNPAIYDLSTLLALGHQKGFTFSMETQGSIVKPYFSQLDFLTLSPKPPSSKMVFIAETLAAAIKLHPDPTLKIVVADENDYQFARMIHQIYPSVPMTLQPCNLAADRETAPIETLNHQLKWLIERTQKDQWYDVRLLPQLHVILWHNQRGV